MDLVTMVSLTRLNIRILILLSTLLVFIWTVGLGILIALTYTKPMAHIGKEQQMGS